MLKAYWRKNRNRLDPVLGRIIPKWVMFLALMAASNKNTFSGLVRNRLAFDRSALMVTLVDKHAARDYARQKSKSIKLPTLYQLVDSADDLDPELWPEEYVIKPTFGSGALIMVSESQKSGLEYEEIDVPFSWSRGRIGMNCGDVDVEAIRQLAHQWLLSDYEYWNLKYPEWAYGQVPKRIVVEELVQNSDGSQATEMRIYCFGGRAELTRITDTLVSRKAWAYDRHGNLVNIWTENIPEVNVGENPIPANWEEIMVVAESVSARIDFIRVDLFATDHGIYLSELTPYPNGGTVDFLPREQSMRMARLWRQAKQSR